MRRPRPDGMPDTHFAPAPRAEPEQVQAARSQVRSNRVAALMLEAIPGPAMVLNAQRQIVAANHRMAALAGAASEHELVGRRPGEAAGCLRAPEAPNGCGTGPFCITCGAANAILDCLATRAPVVRECRLVVHGGRDGGALDLEVHATPLTLSGVEMVVLALRDISAEKRRSVLEHVFFHDVLNTAGGIRAVAELLVEDAGDPERAAAYLRDLGILSAQIIEEIGAQRELLAAERGDLMVHPVPCTAASVLADVVALYEHHRVAHDRHIGVGPVADLALEVDRTLLRRVLGNLVKNALEAVPDGETVRLGAEALADGVRFTVWNPGVMPEEVQRQVFQRSFSTKSGYGRGIGTYSIRLLTEGYLGGQVGFTSTQTEGTTFWVTVPCAPAAVAPS